MAFDDDLLELAEGPASPRKGNTSGSKKTKRKRPAQESVPLRPPFPADRGA